MTDIIEPTMDFDFSTIHLGPPVSLSGGSYFTRILNKNKPLFLQTTKCLTKQGFIKNGKKNYTDLMIDNGDTMFINWIENLQTRCQDLMFSKSDIWFETKLDKDDIECAFTSPFKLFKSGKFYILRTSLTPNIKIYDEDNNVISLDDVGIDKTLISILEIQGIKFTSRNFQIEFTLKQCMIVSPDPFLDQCFIKKPMKPQSKILTANEQTSALDIPDATKTTMDLFITESINELGIDATSADADATTDADADSVATSNIELELDIEELDINEPPNSNESLTEIDLGNDKAIDQTVEPIQLKAHHQVYYELYAKAREKAKELKQNAIKAFLEAKNIKNTYMLDVMDDSDSELDNFEDENPESDDEYLRNN